MKKLGFLKLAKGHSTIGEDQGSIVDGHRESCTYSLIIWCLCLIEYEETGSSKSAKGHSQIGEGQGFFHVGQRLYGFILCGK